jgi:hypothetical protein
MIHPFKDEEEHPVATVWRSTICAVVDGLRAHDYSLSCGVDGVRPIREENGVQIEEYIEDYGERLDALPEAAWDTSVAMWMDGHWDLLVDLWTIEAGSSDLALNLRIFETGEGFEIQVGLVYVP